MILFIFSFLIYFSSFTSYLEARKIWTRIKACIFEQGGVSYSEIYQNPSPALKSSSEIWLEEKLCSVQKAWVRCRNYQPALFYQLRKIIKPALCKILETLIVSTLPDGKNLQIFTTPKRSVTVPCDFRQKVQICLPVPF